MKSVVIAIIILLSSVFTNAQEPSFSEVNQDLYSSILKEKRAYRISLPKSYYNKKYSPASYPVLYLLDGEMAFDYYVSIVQFLSRGVYAHIPEMIVVGIDNTDRTRDLTPTKASKLSPDDSTKLLFTNSGGGLNFLNFISRELIPLIESKYRTNGFKVFAGHSFGGLFATWVLLNHPSTFNAYLIHDPSLWWHNQLLLKQTAQLLPSTQFNQARVYVSQANNEEKGSFDEHFESIKKFKWLSDSIKHPTLSLKYKFYENEDHGTLPLPASYDGLKAIFAGYWCDFKKISSNKNYLTDHYKAFSKNIHHSFKPSEPMIDFIMNYYKKDNKMEEAGAMLKLYQTLYPKTAPLKL